MTAAKLYGFQSTDGINAIGVHGISCVVNGRIYLGSSANLSQRRAAHFSQLRCGTHHCKALMKDFLKYGERSFTFSVIELHATKAAASEAEKRIIRAKEDKGIYNTVTHLLVVPQIRPDADRKTDLASKYSYRPIIDLWPSLTALAADLEVSAECVRVMKMRDSIGARYWMRLVDAAGRRSLRGVNLESLAIIEAGRNGFLLEAAA